MTGVQTCALPIFESLDIHSKEYRDKNEETLSAFLTMIGTKDFSHKDGSLYDHLMRTYYILQVFFDNPTLSLIGGLHSVYGTTIYKKTCLPKESNLVKDVFGAEVDRLVRIFGTMDRRLLENPDQSLSENDFTILRLVEVANLYDQGPLVNRPNLIKFAKDVQEKLKTSGQI